MRILGIETSTRDGSVALVHGDAVVAEVPLPASERHESGLAPATREVLAAAGIGLSGLDAIVVGLGPGSYTGVRIGVTFAKTLAFASGVRLVGLCGLMAQAVDGADGDEVVAVMERAHAGRAYGAVYEVASRWPRALHPPAVCEPGELLEGLASPVRVVGAGAELFGDAIHEAGHRVAEAVPVRAATLAKLGMRYLRNGGVPADPEELTPLYLQAPAPER